MVLDRERNGDFYEPGGGSGSILKRQSWVKEIWPDLISNPLPTRKEERPEALHVLWNFRECIILVC